MLGRAANTTSFISLSALVIVVSAAVIFLDAVSPLRSFIPFIFPPSNTTGDGCFVIPRGGPDVWHDTNTKINAQKAIFTCLQTRAL